MLCTKCYGKGFVKLDTDQVILDGGKITPVHKYVTCAECRGFGVVYCCEGEGENGGYTTAVDNDG